VFFKELPPGKKRIQDAVEAAIRREKEVSGGRSFAKLREA